MNSELALISDLCISTAHGSRSRRKVADLVRQIVHGRRGISRIAVVNWVLQFMEYPDHDAAAAFVNSVIDMLCELHDIGYGTVHGEPVLVALPERYLELPDGRVVALGDHNIIMDPSDGLLFPVVNSNATETLVDFLHASDEPDIRPVDIPALSPDGRWSMDRPMPHLLRHALAISGTFDPATLEWSVSLPNILFLNEWFGLSEQTNLLGDQLVSDPDQRRVINAAATSRKVVEAGPGSGKTYTACARIIELVQEAGLSPSRILLLSFTRVAVAELRDRISGQLQQVSNTAALQIRTFDSFAANMLNLAGCEAPVGYDASVRTATRLLKSDNLLVTDTIRQIEHVIIDEAQDLVGHRRELCEALIQLLHPDCGITVFGDFAQSIYNYQQQDESGTTFLATVANRNDFTCDRLEYDHRTQTDTLKDMFHSVRYTLRDSGPGSKETYFQVREQIMAAALENEIIRFATHSSTTRGLILTRSRRGLLTVAETLRASGRRFRLRLTDRPLRVAPWIGSILGGRAASEQISYQTFNMLHAELYPPAGHNADKCWEILLDLDGSGRDSILVGRVADSLVTPPLALISDHEGDSGPLVSTIHASKGSEDSRVMLLLTRAPHGENIDWGEEARTLYVGATRACKELRTGWINPAELHSIGRPARYWSAHADCRKIEIGLDTDLIGWRDFLRTGHVAKEDETIAHIWQSAMQCMRAEAVPDSEGRLIVRTTGQRKLPIGCLSASFAEAVQTIRKSTQGAVIPGAISDIAIVGATTVVVPGRAGMAPTLALMPLLGGFARVPR